PEERAHEVGAQARPDDLGAEAEHVHVVVLDALVRGVPVVADRGADARHLARGDRSADARSAHEHASLRAAGEDRLADLASLVGIVDPHGVGVGAEVDDLVAVRAQRLEDCIAKMDSAMIEGDGDVHDTRSRSASARATTLSAVKPNFSSTTSPGADAPKCSIEMESPSSPTHCFHPSLTPASIETRALTSAGRISSR